MSPVIDRSDLPIRLVVLNHNGGEMTLRCLQHLHDLEWPSDRLQIVCLDNNSSDGSIERVENEFPDVDVRRLRSNHGFPANNEALGDLDHVRFVGLVNNDAFVEPQWLRKLVEALDSDRGVGAVCPKILLEPEFSTVALSVPMFDAGRAEPRTLGVKLRGVTVEGIDVSSTTNLGDSGWGRDVDEVGTYEWTRPETVLRIPAPSAESPFSAVLTIDAPQSSTANIDSGSGPTKYTLSRGVQSIHVEVSTQRRDVIHNVGSVVYDDGYGADRGWLQFDDGQFDTPAEVFAWCGGGVLFRPEYLEDVGLFDPAFFLYYEDTDLSWRGRARGWRYKTVPTARMRHVHSASTGEVSALTSYFTERNRLLMLVRNAPIRQVVRQVFRYPLATASYARRDVLHPLVQRQRPTTVKVSRRVRSYLGLLRLLPLALTERRALRARQLVPDSEIEGWFVSH